MEPDRGSGGRSGWFSMLLLALFFLLAGSMMVWGPNTFWSAGGLGQWAETPTMAVYSKGVVLLLGRIGILIAVFLFAVAWRIYKGKQ